MTTAVATGWSGLVNNVHGTTYETVGERIAVGGQIQRLLQKRGMQSVVKAVTGSDPQGRNSIVDPDEGDFNIPGAIGGVVSMTNMLGGLRTIGARNTPAATDATGFDMLFNTTINKAYVADLSGNGGAALALGTTTAEV